MVELRNTHDPITVVTNRMDAGALKLLQSRCRVVANSQDQPWTRSDLLDRARGATALLAFMTDRIDDEFLENCPCLKIVACALKGFDNFDVEAFSRRGIWLSVVPDLLSAPTAELAIGLMIAAARNVLNGDRLVRSGIFQGWRPTHAGLALYGSTVGIVGMGSLGRAIALRLKGFEAKLVYYDTHHAPHDLEQELGLQGVACEELLRISDFILLAVPLTAQTTHLIDGAALELMKPTTVLINTARGSLVDEAAVAAALSAGKIAAYASDVFELEDQMRPDRPRSISSGLMAHPRTIFTPHVGSAIPVIRRQIEVFAANSIVRFLDGVRPPPGAVNNIES